MIARPPRVRSNTASGQEDPWLVQVVHLYYQRQWTQKQIAERYSVSTMTVSRALKRAESLGLVEIRLHLPISNNRDLELQLADALGIKEVFVTVPPEPPLGEEHDQEYLRDFVGRSAAFCAAPLLADGVTVGVALGRTVSRIVEHVHPKLLDNARVVQVMGGLDMSATYNPYDIIQSLSRTLGADGYYFSGTAFVANAKVQEAMIEQNTAAGLRELWRRCDICFVGIGTTAKDVPYVRANLLTPEDIAAVEAEGAVGDLLGRFFNLDGEFVAGPLLDRVNAVPIDDLRCMGRVLVTAAGDEKVDPIIGVARTGVPVTLVTDDRTAHAVLKKVA